MLPTILPEQKDYLSGVFSTWRQVSKPKIPDDVIKSVQFMYDSAKDAHQKQNPRATAFLISVEGVRPEIRHIFIITCGHCVDRRQNRFIRIEKTVGDPIVIESKNLEWVGRNDADLAIAHLELISSEYHEYFSIPSFCFQSKDDYEKLSNEEVVIIGCNTISDSTPEIRYGHILKQNEIIEGKQSSGRNSIILSTPCQSGFSGSPSLLFGKELPMPIIGVVWATIDPDNSIPEGSACVLPAYMVREVLESEDEIGHREDLELTYIAWAATLPKATE